MKTIPSDILSLWEEEGSRLIQQNLAEFNALVKQAQDYVNAGKYDAGAIYAGFAAFHANCKHCGIFVSPELEKILLTIGQKAISNRNFSQKNPRTRTPKKILHISTNVSSFSGIPRLMRRWIQQDSDRSHSIVLTKQAPDPIPESLQDTVSKSGGKIYVLNDKKGGIIARAQLLREIAATADIVVIQTWEHDVIPTIAFADKENSPPIIYVNHGDHWFWLGAGISDVIANLRESGMRLSQKRRGIEVKRNLLLPTILEPINRKLTRIEAKQQLGIDENTILLLSIARSVKYRKPFDGISFADAHVPLLKRHENACLWVIGPGKTEDWSTAIQQTNGRIKVFPETEDTATFYQAADIYVDSFPFVSITSLLEAGSYGVPLITRYPYPSDACEILGADMPGLTGNLLKAKNLDDYTASLSQLIEDEQYRKGLGEATSQKITQTHLGDGWQHYLEQMYERAATLPRVTAPSGQTYEIGFDEADAFVACVHGGNFNLQWIIKYYLGVMPLAQRWQYWRKLSQSDGSRLPLSELLPEWLYIRYRRLRQGA